MTIAHLRIKFEIINSSDKIIVKIEYWTNTKRINQTGTSSFKLIIINLFSLTYTIAIVDILTSESKKLMCK